MEWDTLLYAVLPIVASLVTLLITQQYERRRAHEDREHDLERVALEQRHAIAVRLFDQRFETYDGVLRRAQDAVEAAEAYSRSARVDRLIRGAISLLARGVTGAGGTQPDDEVERGSNEPFNPESFNEANSALARAERDLLVELDRAMLLATQPVRKQLMSFQSAVFGAKKLDELSAESESPQLIPSFQEIISRRRATQSYAQMRAALREMMSDEMRAETWSAKLSGGSSLND